MLLFPEKTKFKKKHKNFKVLKKKESSFLQPLVGFSGLKVLKAFRITAKQIEAFKKTIVRIVKRKYKYKTKLRFDVFPDIPVTKKSSGIRMGKGKGKVGYWCFLVKQGRILCEFDSGQIPLGIIFKSLLIASNKLPVRTLVIL